MTNGSDNKAPGIIIVGILLIASVLYSTRDQWRHPSPPEPAKKSEASADPSKPSAETLAMAKEIEQNPHSLDDQQPPPVASQAEFAKVIRGAGYEIPAQVGNTPPYFLAKLEGLQRNGQTLDFQVIYLLSPDKRYLVFGGVARHVRNTELPKMDMDQLMSGNPDDSKRYVPELIQKLNGADPVQGTKFEVVTWPDYENKDAVVVGHVIVMQAVYENKRVTEGTIKQAVALLDKGLVGTFNIWK